MPQRVQRHVDRQRRRRDLVVEKITAKTILSAAGAVSSELDHGAKDGLRDKRNRPPRMGLGFFMGRFSTNRPLLTELKNGASDAQSVDR